MEQGIIRPFYPVIVAFITWLLFPLHGYFVKACFFILVVLLLSFGIFYSHKRKTQQYKEREADNIKKILAHQRHDWMNDVQILLGYLSLKKHDRMRSYLEGLIHKTNQERFLSELSYAPLAVFLLTLSHRYVQWKIDIKMENMYNSTIQEQKKLVSILGKMIPWLEMKLQNEIVEQLYIHILKDMQLVTILHIGDNKACIPPSFLNDLEYMRNTIRKYNGEICFNPDEDTKLHIII